MMRMVLDVSLPKREPTRDPPVGTGDPTTGPPVLVTGRDREETEAARHARKAPEAAVNVEAHHDLAPAPGRSTGSHRGSIPRRSEG